MSSKSSTKYAFRAITLSGLSGTGKSALYRNLRPILEPKGFRFFAAGELFRQTAGEYHHPTADKMSEDFHEDTEKRLKEFLETEEHVVLDAWLGGFVARDMPDVLRVLTYVSDPDERLRRYAAREKVDIETARKLVRERDESNLSMWHKLYGDFDFWDPKYYQLTIDTAVLDEEECVEKVISNLVV